MKFIKSITKIRFYREIYDQPFKKSLLYVIIMSLIVYIAGAFILITKVDNALEKTSKLLVDQIPKFSINNGKLEVEVKQPYEMTIGTRTIIIDTISSIDLTKYKDKDQVILFTEETVKMVNAQQIKFITYKHVMDKLRINSIDKDYLLKVVPALSMVAKKYIILIHIFGYIFWFFFFKFISVLFLSLIGLAINGIQNAKLQYYNIINICAYAITLPWIIKLVYNALTIKFSLDWSWYVTIYWITAILYVFLAIKDVKKYRDKKCKENNPYNATIMID